MSATTVPSAWESMVETGKRLVTRRRGRPPHDSKWDSPKRYALAAVLANAKFSLALPLVSIAIPHPLFFAAWGYSWWAGYHAVQNVRRTYKAARMEAESRILGRNQLPPVLPTTPKRSTSDSFNNLSHTMLSVGLTIYTLPQISGMNYEQQKECTDFAGLTVVAAAFARGIGWVSRLGDKKDDDQPPKPPQNRPPSAGGPA